MLKDAPIIVSGAGPVGLAFALGACLRGLPVRVFEKRAALSTASRASTFHPPTLEILDELGVFEQIRPKGQVVERIGYFSVAEGLVADFPLQLVGRDTRLPYRFHLEQALLTPALLAALRQRDRAALAFDTEVVGLRDGADGPNAIPRLAGQMGILRSRRGRMRGAWEGGEGVINPDPDRAGSA